MILVWQKHPFLTSTNHRSVSFGGSVRSIGSQAETVLSRCCCRLARRYDLVCDAAREFRHVIELERVAADSGGSRTHLHDEVSDLRLRHLHAHHVPARPALAGIEA